ncbi:MAG: pro-sigmaK processing inhibitor BofA family protein [Oscillospiraceae bacterium]
METVANFAPWIVVALLAVTALLALRKPLRWLFRLFFRTGVGLAALALFGQLGSFLGVTLGVNLVNALVLGVLGVPGFGLLLMLNWVFTAC